MESKKKKIEKLIKQYNEPTINNKDEILDKMIKLNSYISFQDKLNSIFSIIDKNVICQHFIGQKIYNLTNHFKT